MDTSQLTLFAQIFIVARLAMAVVFAVVMWGLAHYLEQQFSRVLAAIWSVRTVLAVSGSVAWLVPQRDGPVSYVLVVIGGAGTVLMAIYCWQALRLAAGKPHHLPRSLFLLLMSACGIISAMIHAANVGGMPNVVIAGFLWTRALQVLCFLLLTIEAYRLWRHYPLRRNRIGPMIVACSSAAICFFLDAQVLWTHLWYAPSMLTELDGAMSLTVGALVFGIAALWSALEFEREHLTAQAEALHQSQVVAAEGARLESLGRLASGIAHDVNNLLSIVNGAAELARDALPTTATTAERHLAQVTTTITRGGEVMRQLLQFARRDRSVPVVVSVHAVVHAIRPVLDRVVGRNITLRVHLGDDALIAVDPVLLQQAVVRLVVHAADALPGGGLITVAVDSWHIDAPRTLTRGELGTGQYARLSVQYQRGPLSATRQSSGHPDHGLADRVFEPFYVLPDSGRPRHGLAGVAQVVCDARGAVDLEEHAVHGTTIRLVLPVRQQAIAA